MLEVVDAFCDDVVDEDDDAQITFSKRSMATRKSTVRKKKNVELPEDIYFMPGKKKVMHRIGRK